MVFSNIIFIYAFLPLCLLAYRLARSLKAKNYILLVASLVFYGLGEPVYILLMLASAGSAFLFALLIDSRRGAAASRILLAVSVSINLGFLFFFKYAPLFAQTVSQYFRIEIQAPRVTLPIGISFYTFQILTYTIDVYRGKSKIQLSPVKFLLYVSMFPQLIAGPIVRYEDVARQLDKRSVDPERFSAGVVRFICGMAKKVLIADYAGGVAEKLLNTKATFTGIGNVLSGAGSNLAGAGSNLAGAGSNLMGAATGVGGISTLCAWFGILFFGFQIYFDFSGYSDMAIGLGRMFGFEFMENFNHPYSSRSVTEFWRRWHISLGTFFRDYVYIPLGGNRRHQLRNIAVVWVLTGFWHGAGWNFVTWGCYFGIILIAEKYVFRRIPIKPPAPVGWLYCFIAVFVGWCIFYFTDLTQAWDTISAMFAYRPEADLRSVDMIKDNLFFLCFCMFAAMPWAKRIYDKVIFWGGGRNGRAAAIADSALTFCYAATLLITCSVVGVISSFSPFLYFRF